ncbi:MAG: hypothetical protein AB8C84_08705 [Oligoflexales bacterium]
MMSLALVSIINDTLAVALRIKADEISEKPKKTTLQRAVKAYKIASPQFMSFLRLRHYKTATRREELRTVIKSTISRVFDPNFKAGKDSFSEVFGELGVTT